MNKLFAVRSIALGVLVLVVGACGSNPNKPEEMDTTLERSQPISHDSQVGMNSKGEVVTTRKVHLADQLRGLQKDVYNLEVEIYGDQELGRRGLYGILRRCLDEGSDLKRLPARTILTKPEDDVKGKMVIDENDQLVNVSEEYFIERIKRFEGYKEAYLAQKDDFEEKVRICEHDLKKKKAAGN